MHTGIYLKNISSLAALYILKVTHGAETKEKNI